MTTSNSDWEQAALRRASAIAAEFGQAQVDSGHLALALLELFPDIAQDWHEHGVRADDLRLDLRRDLTPSRGVRGYDFPVARPVGEIAVSRAVAEALRHRDPVVGSGGGTAGLSELLLELLPQPYRARLNGAGTRRSGTRRAGRVGDRPGTREDRSLAPSIASFVLDLTDEARTGRLGPLIGRERELHQVVRVLCRKNKRNPVLVGEPGVGKTAIVEGLARLIAAGRVPDPLTGAQLLAISLPGMLEGTRYRGEFEGRAQALLSAVRTADHPVIVFLDEIHLMAQAGAAEGGLDLASMMLGAMARGEVAVVGASTPHDLRRSLQDAGPLARRLQPVRVDEPDEAETLAVLDGLRSTYETFHGVRIDRSALRVAVAPRRRRHALPGHQPDLALDVLDDACVEARLRHEGTAGSEPPVVRDTDVEAVLADRFTAPRVTRRTWRDVRARRRGGERRQGTGGR